MNFANKVVLITGAGSGIGEATALLFAKYSAKLSLVDIQQETLQKVGEKCESVSGTKALTLIADVTQDNEVKKIVEDTVREFGKIDVLVNSAGIAVHGNILDENCMEIYDRIMNINLRSVVCLTNSTAPFLVESKGCIVNLSSSLASIPSESAFAYCASKAAISHFTRCIALELAPKGVRVNAVQPGFVKTNLIKHSGLNENQCEEYFENVKKLSLTKQITEAEEIAELIVFLASDKAKSITGSNYLIDRGMVLLGSQTMPK